MEIDDSGVTPAIFRQLHIKLPTPTFREPAPEDWGDTKPSDDWLDEHSGGFLLMQNLKPSYPMGKSMLVQSIGTGKLFYAAPSPPELRFSTLYDPHVEAQLPDEPYFPKLHAYGLPQGRKEPYNKIRLSDVYSLYFQHYNGGTLSNLMEMYSDRRIGGPVPESFIWHVTEQLSRAILYLHCGYTREDLLELYYPDNTKGKGKGTRNLNWRSIIHRAITADNVLLNFPDGDDPVDRCFPDIILEGFDKAGFIDDNRENWAQNTITNRGEEVEIGPSSFEDMHLFGELLRRLVTVSDFGKNKWASRLDYDVNVEGKLSPYLSNNLKLGAGQEPAYSDDLIKLLMKWELPALQKGDGARYPDIGVHTKIKSVFFLRDEVLPIAMRKVAEYVDKWNEDPVFDNPVPERDDIGDVSWVKPDPSFETIPYATTRHREDKILEQYEKELKWLFGPYVPVWYRYDAVGITNIHAAAKEFYTPPTGTREMTTILRRKTKTVPRRKIKTTVKTRTGTTGTTRMVTRSRTRPLRLPPPKRPPNPMPRRRQT
ncbi:uncharacterized protein B0H64DRAFT_436421 [Chaetomium fimeti]|uniref:Protein kinase domain-containing protein n=1 Tax=Chaetomium fimeti TaxID=1854472 RepID=A0AAE0H727_9PEZI|nr:hypothetical protein B0H64DRAFT_436421 [Chaetomium fimeti]